MSYIDDNHEDEMFEDYLKNKPDTKKRFLANISFYCYAETDEQAFNKANKICNELISRFDNNATIDTLYSQQFGELSGRKINILKIKNNETH